MRKDDKDIWGILNCEFIMYIEIRIVKYQEVPVRRQVPLGVFFFYSLIFFFVLGKPMFTFNCMFIATFHSHFTKLDFSFLRVFYF